MRQTTIQDFLDTLPEDLKDRVVSFFYYVFVNFLTSFLSLFLMVFFHFFPFFVTFVKFLLPLAMYLIFFLSLYSAFKKNGLFFLRFCSFFQHLSLFPRLLS